MNGIPTTEDKKYLKSELLNSKLPDVGEDSDAYTLIYKNESTAYAFATVNEETSLSISEDDIKTAFSLMTVNNI